MSDFWGAWNWNPLTGGLLALLAWRYMDGVWRMWRRAGVGRGIAQWQVGAFWAGWAALFIALISPIDTYGETSLAVHMVQHLLLMLVAAPLLVLGLPPIAQISMIPVQWRRGLVRGWHRRKALRSMWMLLSAPLAAWGIFAGVMWGWHLPALYQAALREPSLHLLEHVSFMGAALLFWWSVGARQALGFLSVFTAAVHSSLLVVHQTNFVGPSWV